MALYPSQGLDTTARLRQLEAYSQMAAGLGDPDSDGDGYGSDDSLDHIYAEINQLEMVIAQQRSGHVQAAQQAAYAQQQAAYYPPQDEGYYPQGGGGASVFNPDSYPDDENCQIVQIRGLPQQCEEPPQDLGPKMEALVIKEDVNIEYDKGGFPYVAEPKPPTPPPPCPGDKIVVIKPPCPVHNHGHGHGHGHGCPQHGPPQPAGCAVHQPGHGHVHGHAHGHVQAVPALPAPVAQPALHGPPARRVIVRKQKAKKKTLFEQLIS